MLSQYYSVHNSTDTDLFDHIAELAKMQVPCIQTALSKKRRKSLHLKIHQSGTSLLPAWDKVRGRKISK